MSDNQSTETGVNPLDRISTSGGNDRRFDRRNAPADQSVGDTSAWNKIARGETREGKDEDTIGSDDRRDARTPAPINKTPGDTPAWNAIKDIKREDDRTPIERARDVISRLIRRPPSPQTS